MNNLYSLAGRPHKYVGMVAHPNNNMNAYIYRKDSNLKQTYIIIFFDYVYTYMSMFRVCINVLQMNICIDDMYISMNI